MNLIAAPELFDGEAMRGPSLVAHADGVIVSVEPWRGKAPAGALELHGGTVLAPGFIDVQVNGGGGVFLNATPDLKTIAKLASAHRRFGTTGLLPTLITDAPQKMQALAAVAQEALALPGILGFHLEGPFLNPARKGIHPPEHMRTPTDADRDRLKIFSACGASFMTLAPERIEHGFLDFLVSTGLRIAIGHSDATTEEAQEAFARGVTGVTHLFNAMSQMMPRNPGVVGATMADDRVFAGIICDGLHVAPENLRAAYKAIGRDRLMLVTDAMPTAASDRTSFMIGERKITLDNGKLCGPDGTLAGAHITMIETVKNAVRLMRCPLSDALVMASRTPAQFLGLEQSRGRIAPGYRADIVAFTADYHVTDTWIGGAHEYYPD